MPSTLATMISKLSGKISGPKTPPKPRTPAEERAYYIARKNIEKAFDAILVAIGIVAVLIVNVTFVGYLTPPGGVHPYWEDCYYSMFQGFIIANGFALVFSLAAIAVVTLGPYILTLRHQQEWRIPVVNIGLLHLCLSLSSLLLAFAFAGYVNANVGVPHLSCSNVPCEAGGIACSQFVKPPDHFGEFKRGEKYNSAQDSAVATPWTFAADGSFGLDAQVEKLNADVFYNSGQYNASNRIACFEYGLLYNNSFANGVPLHPDACSEARGCNTTFTPCFSLVSRRKAAKRVAGVDYAVPPSPNTTWCAADIADLGGGGGFLTLDWDTSAALLSEVMGICLSHNLTYSPHYAGRHENITVHNDHYEQTLERTELNDTYATIPMGANFSCPALPDEYATYAADSASSGQLWRLLDTPPPPFLNESLFMDEAGRHVDRLDRYANILSGADGDSQRFTEEREGCPAIVLRPGPLRNAFQYRELRYKCAPENNVLCDYGPPDKRLRVPLAVEESGKYLTKSELALHSNAYAVAFEVTGGTFVGVTIMLIVAVLANVFSILYLTFSNLKSSIESGLTSEESWKMADKLRTTSIPTPFAERRRSEL